MKVEGVHQPTAGMPPLSEDRIDLFWQYIQVADGENCWLWTGAVDKDGYGKVRVGKRDIRAHRLLYFLATGIDPIGFLILHSCDRPSCCNPEHVQRGTNDQNMADMVAKGRGASGERSWRKMNPDLAVNCPGEKNGMARLNTKQVLDIRKRCGNGESMRSVGMDYKMTSSSVGRIVRRERWASV